MQKADTIAIIPARSGSKRLPQKNILRLAGKPLIQWTVDAARSSGVIDLIVVSTDDERIIKLYIEDDDVSIIRRPELLATDTATSVDVVLHTLQELNDRGIVPKRVVLLQPTSPLRKGEDIEQAIKKMDGSGAESLISVCKLEHPIEWCGKLDSGMRMGDFYKNTKNTSKRSQDCDEVYRLNGSIYCANTSFIVKNNGFLGEATLAFVMPPERSQDIDTIVDFKICEGLLLG